MRITKTWEFKKISKTYSTVCPECERVAMRTESDEYREDARPETINGKWKSLGEKALRKSGMSEICTKCKKKKLPKSDTAERISQDDIDDTDRLSGLIRTAKSVLVARSMGLTKIYRGRIFTVVDNEEWVCSGFYYCNETLGITVRGWRINKRQPWKSTDIYQSFHLCLPDFLPETLQQREDSVK